MRVRAACIAQKRLTNDVHFRLGSGGTYTSENCYVYFLYLTFLFNFYFDNVDYIP